MIRRSSRRKESDNVAATAEPSSPGSSSETRRTTRSNHKRTASAFADVTNALKKQKKQTSAVTPMNKRRGSFIEADTAKPSPDTGGVIDIYAGLTDECNDENGCIGQSHAFLRHYGRDYYGSLKDWEEVFFESQSPHQLPHDSSDASSISSRSTEDRPLASSTPPGRVGYSGHTTIHGLDDVSVFSNGSKESQILEHQPQLTDKMRAVLVDWMVELSMEYNLTEATLHLAVVLLNRSLECETNVLEIGRDSFQCLGCVCVWLASKIEETCAPSVEDFSYISADSYSTQQICNLELSICTALQFKLWQVTPFHFVDEFLRASMASTSTKSCAVVEKSMLRSMILYLLELSLLPYEMVSVAPRKVTAAAVYLAHVVLGIRDSNSGNFWTPTLEYYSACQKSDLEDLVGTIHKYHMVAEESKLNHAFCKYSKKEFHHVALKTVPLAADIGF